MEWYVLDCNLVKDVSDCGRQFPQLERLLDEAFYTPPSGAAVLIYTGRPIVVSDIAGRTFSVNCATIIFS